MTNRNRPLPLLLACLLATALTTACAPTSPEAGRPNTAPPTTAATAPPSATATGSPTGKPTPTAPPVRPSNAAGLTLSAGEAFISYYVSLLNYAYVTGDSQYLLNASDKGCIGCKGISDFVKSSNGQNGGLTGDYLDHLVSVDDIARGSNGRLGGSAEIRTGAYVEISSPSAKPEPQTAGSAMMQFTLSSAGGNWVMYEMEINEE